jgi:hypothetical protein
MKSAEIKTQIADTFDKIIREYLATEPSDDECSQVEDGTGDIRFESNLLLNEENIFGLSVLNADITINVDYSTNEFGDDIEKHKLSSYNGTMLVELCVGVIQHFNNEQIEEIAMTHEVYRHAVNYVNKLHTVNFSFDTLYDLLVS